MPDIARRRVISASPSSPAFKNSPPFEELGCFDEESCRYFLREVGRRVVPFYPFTFGMEEVYSLILERFGYPGIPDVTSVLQELLENDDVAGGFGDDGDIWRSWRHSWRHRNDDSLNPFIPKIGNFILQAPTEPHIRRIKAQNFIRQSERACSHDEGTTSADRSGNEIQEQSARPSPRRHRQIEDEDTYILPATTFSHQRTRTMLASGNPLALHAYGGQERPSSDRHSVTSAASSQQEFIEVEPSNLNSDIDPSLLVSFEMLTNDPSSPAGFRPNLRGGQAEVVTLQQVRSESGPTDNERASGEAHFAGVEQPAAEAEVADTKVVHDQYGNPAQGKELDSPKQEESMDDQYGNPAGEEPADDDDDSLELARPFAGAPAGREPTLNVVETQRLSPAQHRSANVFGPDGALNSAQSAVSSSSRSTSNSSTTHPHTFDPSTPNSSTEDAVENTQSSLEQRRPVYAFEIDRPLISSAHFSKPIMADYNKPLPLTPGEIVRSMSTHHQQPSQRPSQPRVSDSHTTSVAARPTGVMNSLSHSQASRGAYPTTRASVPARHRFLPPWASGDQHAASTADPQKPTEHPSPRPFCLGTSTLEDPFIDPPALTPPPRPSAPVPFNLSASDAAGHRGTQAREFLNTSTLEDPFTDPPALTPPPRPSAPVPFDLSASDAASRRGTQTRAFLNTGFYGSQGTHPTAGLQPPPRPKLRRATLAFIPPPHSFVQIPVSHVASNASLRSPQAGTSPKTGHGRSQAATNFNGEVSADGSAVDDRWAPALPVSAAGIPGADHAAGVPEAQHAAGSTWSMKKIVSFEEPLESKEVNAETPDKQQHDNKTREGSMNKLRSHLKNSNFFPFSQPSIEEKVNAWMETVEPDAEVMPYQEDVNEAFGHDSEETDEGARLETEPVKDEPTSEMKEEEAEKGLTPEIQNSHEEMAPETEEHDPSPEPPPLVSLDPTNQARILSTLQLMLRTTASNFLVNEAGAGRLRPETIRGVQGEWAASGGRRPVLDFLYPTDLQVKLVTADRRRLIFGAPNFNNFDWLLEATLEQWLEIATHMDAWNYCSPDKEILAWIHGLTTVLTMLNAPEASLGELRAVAVWAVRVIAARKAAGLGRTL